MKFQELITTLGDKFVPAVEEQLLILASEKPDFVYKEQGVCGSCKYDGPACYGYKIVGPECSGCIFGQAFQRLGWEPPDYIISGTIRDVMEHYMKCPEGWVEIQETQDKGKTWKEAVSILTGGQT
jgi:hypothetical protein